MKQRQLLDKTEKMELQLVLIEDYKMDQNQLNFILQEGEGFKIEFKESLNNIDKEIVAFANAQGGRIFLGVGDDDKVKGLNPKDFGKVSRTRNPLIAGLLARTEYVEKIGTGINRIITAMKNANLLLPKFEYNTSFFITLHDKTHIHKDVTEEKILISIKENPKITIKELVELTGLTRRGIEWNLSQLKERGIITRIGPDKGGYWKVIEK